MRILITPFVTVASVVLFASFVPFVPFMSPAIAGAQATATTWDAVYTAEQAKRGDALYRANCALCHGDTLTGSDVAPALTGDVFNSTWEGVPLHDLYERMRTTMPENKPGSLSRVENLEVLAYLLQYGKFPAGTKELDAPTLSTTTYRTFRP